MAKKKKNKKSEANGRRRDAPEETAAALNPEVKKTVAAIVFFVLALLFALSAVGKGGSAGGALYRFFSWLLGGGYFFAPLTMVFVGVSLFTSAHTRVLGASLAGGILFLVANLALMHIVFGPASGGIFGSFLGGTLLRLFDYWASLVIVFGMVIASVLLMLNVPFWKREESGEEAEEEPEALGDAAGGGIAADIQRAIHDAFNRQDASSSASVRPAPTEEQSSSPRRPEADQAGILVRKIAKKFDYTKPPLDLLQSDRGRPSSGDIRANANIIKRTLENFGIDVEMGEVSVGPTVTQYTLKPAEGMKLSRIVALANDLSLALAAHPIRIEAPIPGKSLIGVEVPNRSIALVGLRALLEHALFQERPEPLLFTLGRDVAGAPVFADLAKMPHLLISGATGAGKSVAIHSLVTSFLYRNPPQILRFILVDPKRVELSVYNDIPHLLTPVITDAKTTIQSLRWATREMDRRYDLLSGVHARDITNYNAALAKSGDEDILPYIVIIIDELADLMATFSREVEASIIRLAQMARAVGIHLIVATQRPSVEVITGLIKANITSRIALQVASQVDSRTILDAAGAEKLLGNGDMLFLAGDTAKPRRIQGAYVSEQEVKRVVDFLREEAAAPEYDRAILEARPEQTEVRGEEAFGDDDPLLPEARDLVVQAGKASASYLQRRLRVGYARAARLLDLLETQGVIGPGEGAKPREVFIKTAEAPGSVGLENDDGAEEGSA